jgi:hypothetical protein
VHVLVYKTFAIVYNVPLFLSCDFFARNCEAIRRDLMSEVAASHALEPVPSLTLIK